MKKILTFLFVIVLFASCKLDKPNIILKPTIELIVGKWYFTQDTVREYKNGTLFREIANAGINLNRHDYHQFNNDGTCLTNFNTNTENFLYSINGKVIKFSHPSPVVGGASYIQDATIKKLTSDKLTLFYDDTSTDDNGNVIRTTEIAYLSK